MERLRAECDDRVAKLQREVEAAVAGRAAAEEAAADAARQLDAAQQHLRQRSEAEGQAQVGIGRRTVRNTEEASLTLYEWAAAAMLPALSFNASAPSHWTFHPLHQRLPACLPAGEHACCAAHGPTERVTPGGAGGAAAAQAGAALQGQGGHGGCQEGGRRKHPCGAAEAPQRAACAPAPGTGGEGGWGLEWGVTHGVPWCNAVQLAEYSFVGGVLGKVATKRHTPIHCAPWQVASLEGTIRQGRQQLKQLREQAGGAQSGMAEAQAKAAKLEALLRKVGCRVDPPSARFAPTPTTSQRKDAPVLAFLWPACSGCGDDKSH